jgi:Ring finger domain
MVAEMKFPPGVRTPHFSSGKQSLSTFSIARFLESSGGSWVPMNSAVAITWYCLMIVFCVSLSSCLAWCWYSRYIGHQRVRRALQLEQQLEEMSRIEANVQTFSKAATRKQTRLVHSALRDQLKVITKTDVEKMKASRKEQTGDETNPCDSEYQYDSCTICLEDFVEDDKVAQSSNSLCRHCFHQQCIVSWLVTRPHAFCPCCRRPFLCVPTSQTSVGSNENVSSLFGDMESSRPDSSIAAPVDEGTMAEFQEEQPAVDTHAAYDEFPSHV